MSDELRENLAAVQHEIWAHWMRWMFTCGAINDEGEWIMPAALVERWHRQMSTPYSELTEREKVSDLEQADKVLSVLKGARNE